MKRQAFLVLLLLLAVLVSPWPAHAAPKQTIGILDHSVVSHYPSDLTFYLHVRSDAGDIIRASLFFQLGWGRDIRLVPPEPFTPAAEVELTSIWDTSGETMPPFVEITYHWELEDSTGATFSTTPVRVEYTDHTHDWQRLEDEHVVVFWYDQSDEFGQALFEAAQEGYEHVVRITGAATERPARIVIYSDQEDFCAMYPPRGCQEWVGGVSFTDIGVTAQWGFSLSWFAEDVIPHELAHLVYMGEIFRDTWVDVPIWFNEGIAVYNERTDHSLEWFLVLEAAEEDDLVPFRLMDARGGSVVDDEVGAWYAQAYSMVAFLVETYGEETLGELILTLADNVVFEEALVQTTGWDMVQFEMDYRDWLGYPVDFIPTAIVLPTMAVTPFSLPSTPREQPGATATPRAVAEATATPRPTDTPGSEVEPTAVPTTPVEEPPAGGLVLGPVGIVVVVGVVVVVVALGAWWLVRRRG